MKALMLPPFLLCVLLIPSFAFAQQKGATVFEVRKWEVKDGKKVLATFNRGRLLRVLEVKGDRLRVSDKSDEWIRKDDVAVASDAIGIFTDQIKQDPQDSGAYHARGIAWEQKGKY